jgi:hypothetical protein
MSRVTRRSRERDCNPDRARSLCLTRPWSVLRVWVLVLTMAAWASWPPDHVPAFESTARVGTTHDAPPRFTPRADFNTRGLEPPSFCCDGLLGRPAGWDDVNDVEDDDEESVTALLSLTDCRAWFLDAPGASPSWDDAEPSRARFLTLLRFRC